jgi:hypothetical protein
MAGRPTYGRFVTFQVLTPRRTTVFNVRRTTQPGAPLAGRAAFVGNGGASGHSEGWKYDVHIMPGKAPLLPDLVGDVAQRDSCRVRRQPVTIPLTSGSIGLCR